MNLIPYAGRQYGLQFPVMCDGYVSVDYSDNIASEGRGIWDHEGSFTVEDDYLYVQKYNEEYRLLFFLKGMHLIVMKPENEGPGQAWLFTKRSSYTDKDY